jgi:hypothetical protein
MTKIEIKNRFDGKIILCGEYESIKYCLEKNRTADLSSANLRYADAAMRKKILEYGISLLRRF